MAHRASSSTGGSNPGSRPGSASVQGTNDDAQLSKLSCIKLGYYADPFLQYFVRRAVRRSPIINRGYFARQAALSQLLDAFLGHPSNDKAGQELPKQVVSLGAGFDTTFFRLQSQGRAPAKFVELDFPEVTKKKAACIANTPELWQLLGQERPATTDVDNASLVTSSYSLLPADLRKGDNVCGALQKAGINPALPTFVLAECVLVYMEPAESAALVRCLGGLLSTAVFVLYEQIRPDDAFGRQMLMNLESRGCPLRGIRGTKDLAAQKQRFLDNGWQRAEALDMHTVYGRHVDPLQRRRIERLELFDEFEEWNMLQSHYCIAIGYNDTHDCLKDFGFEERSTVPPPPRFADAA
eukprot:jgi/Astpho2/2981/fgenesh1_pm.00051_%23_4_t